MEIQMHKCGTLNHDKIAHKEQTVLSEKKTHTPATEGLLLLYHIIQTHTNAHGKNGYQVNSTLIHSEQ